MLKLSNVCPGTTSSGACDVSIVTNPSPSISTSSGLVPVAVEYWKFPPCKIVSKLFTSVGIKLPSDCFCLNTTSVPSGAPMSSVNVVVFPSPTIVGVLVGSCLTLSK